MSQSAGRPSIYWLENEVEADMKNREVTVVAAAMDSTNSALF